MVGGVMAGREDGRGVMGRMVWGVRERMVLCEVE